MAINIQSHLPHTQNNSYSQAASPVAAFAKASAPKETTSKAAVVTDISKIAIHKSMETPKNSPLSDGEMEQLFSIYEKTGDSELLGDIGVLLQDLPPMDRSNFLSVASRAGSELKEVVALVEDLGQEDRSVFLRTAVRIPDGEGLNDLVKATRAMGDENRSFFFEVADGLGRSRESLKSEELINFITAAGDPYGVKDALLEATADLKEETRANFLKAAAGSGAEMDGLIQTQKSLSDMDASFFLSAASRAQEGLSNLIDLTLIMGGEARSDFLTFTAGLSGENTENLLVSTNGVQKDLSELMMITNDLNGENQTRFLSLASENVSRLSPLMDIVSSLDAEEGKVDNFLSTGIKLNDNFTDFMDIVQGSSGKLQTRALSFAASLSLPDLSNYISAAQTDPNNAPALVRAAESLDQEDLSYLLYAGAVNTQNLDTLIQMTGSMDKVNLGNFLFTAANMGEKMDDFLNTAKTFKGSEMSEFLSGQNAGALLGTEDEKSMRYVYLNSVFDQDTFDALMASDQDIDLLLKELDTLEKESSEHLFSVMAKIDTSAIPELVDIASRLDGEQQDQFMEFSQGLNGERLSNFIFAAKNALDGSFQTLTELMDLTDELSGSEQGYFLAAAAGAGDELEGLMDLTNRLEGPLRTNFLTIADAAVKKGGANFLRTVIDATNHVLDKIKTSYRETAGASDDARRPSSIINVKKNCLAHRYPVSITSFLESGAWIMGSGTSTTNAKNWFNSFMGIKGQ